MPRSLRIQIAGGAYHVTARGCAGRAIFRDDDDRSCFERILADVVQRHEWSCESLCLMTTHYHLVVTTPEADLAFGMKRLNGLFAQSFNRRHGEVGHVFQGRYHSEFIQTEGHRLEVCRYVALNPVRAGLCRRPADWRWSSYAETIGDESPRGFVASQALLRLFADDLDLARSRFQTFVEEGLALERRGQIRLAS